MDLLEIDDLTVRFGTTTGVRNISLQVPAGRITGVLGACESAWVLSHGQVKDSGPVSELLSGVRVADAYLGGLAVTGEAPLPGV